MHNADERSLSDTNEAIGIWGQNNYDPGSL